MVFPSPHRYHIDCGVHCALEAFLSHVCITTCEVHINIICDVTALRESVAMLAWLGVPIPALLPHWLWFSIVQYSSIYSSRYCRNQLQYRFMFTRPNNKVMMAALTCSYEKKQYSLESVAELLQCQWSHDVWHHWTFTSKFSCANKSRRSKDRTVYTVH